MAATPPTATLHVMIATIGRGGPYGLLRLLSSLSAQLVRGDAVTLIYDARDDAHTRPAAAEVLNHMRRRGIAAQLFWQPTNLGHYGHAIRNNWVGALSDCPTTAVLHADDDNEYLPGGIQRIRAAVTQAPEHVHLFRVVRPLINVFGLSTPWLSIAWPPLPLHGKGWSDTGCAAVPFSVNALAAWPLRIGGDGEHYAQAITASGRPPVHHSEAVYRMRDSWWNGSPSTYSGINKHAQPAIAHHGFLATVGERNNRRS